MESSSDRPICLALTGRFVVHPLLAPFTTARAQDGGAVWTYLLHLEHVKAPSTIIVTWFGQEIELRQP
jgi:hypothetical protein